MKNKEVEQQHIESQEEWNKMRLDRGLSVEEFKFVAIGYLDPSEDFEKGTISQNFLNKLRSLYREGMILGSLGHHDCPFCNNATSSTEKILLDKENNIKYIFPEMIFHHIEEHNFKPLNEFVEFVMRS